MVQLTSLRPAADTFSTFLRDALKLELDRGQMRAVRPFAKTLYSEVIIPVGSNVATDKEREDGSIIKDPDAPEDSDAIQGEYLGGLGFTFKFPGDAKKYASLPVPLSHPSSLMYLMQVERGIKDQALDRIFARWAARA